MANILKGFLDANLLQIGDDDDRFKQLEQAAEDLSGQVKEKPLLAYRFMLVGLDGQVPATDPVHQTVDAAISGKWQTMKNKTGPAPVQIYRAVGLRALELVAANDTAVRIALSLIAKNRPPTGEKDDAKDAIRAMLDGFATQNAAEVNEVWVNAVDFSQTKLGNRIKKPAIKEEMAAGVSPDTVTAAIQAGLKGYAEDMQEALRETMGSWTEGLNKLSIRDAKAELLWLAASRYSPSAERGFGEMTAPDKVVHATLDISRSVHAIAPPSVEYFLREFVDGPNAESVKLADLLVEAGPKFAAHQEGKSIAGGSPLGPEGRCSWLERALRPSGATFAEQTGVSADFTGTLGDFAVRFYRELQIRKLLSPAS